MTAGRAAFWAVLVLSLATAVAAAFIFVPRWYAEASQPAREVVAAPAEAAPKIRARLFYISEDGLGLVGVEREVPFGEGTVEQARRIVEAQIEPAPQGFVSPIPAGTTLRAIYVSERGDAFVDLSREVSAAHTGGALEEILTVYSVVNAVTTNLPKVTAVQILVDGHQVDTLAGHVDLRRPLTRNASWIREPAAEQPPQAPGAGAGNPPAR